MFWHSRSVISGDILTPLCAAAELLTEPRSGISRLIDWETGGNTNLFSNVYFSLTSILLYFELSTYTLCSLPIHCDLRSPLFCLECKTHNFSLGCVIKHIFSLVKNNYTDEQNARGKETCFNNTGTKWIIQIRMTGHALTDSQNRSFSGIVILPAISQEETHDLLKPPHLISQNTNLWSQL